ncbi:hypothetical protein GUJ93_ZPchr0152g29219 [Zizania palustris]|uniref:Uncharacterized protein n=1 Tax=Zizania palustris TaxID=103762 RepID=A0A8J5RDL0_ZIZPA|nr:hypothetical protein GUJ93_ZPchr0152g29219 [Zizania palustris]
MCSGPRERKEVRTHEQLRSEQSERTTHRTIAQRHYMGVKNRRGRSADLFSGHRGDERREEGHDSGTEDNGADTSRHRDMMERSAPVASASGMKVWVTCLGPPDPYDGPAGQRDPVMWAAWRGRESRRRR